MKLSLVIPVWNDLDGLDRLLRQVAELGLFSQVIVSDDASDSPVGPENIPASQGFSGDILWLRSDTQRGAGHARNIALERITGSHVIFFDSDDLFAGDFPAIAALAEAETEPFDFVIFRHDDSRILDEGRRGSFPAEEKRWQASGANESLKELTTAQAIELCQISAYPWNKIYRTDFLRENDIRCTEIAVHNDLELHWSSFVVARRILATQLIGATHFFHAAGSRLTNRRGDERLDVFDAFVRVLSRIVKEPDLDQLGFIHPFVHFSFKLTEWIRKNVDGEYHDQLVAKSRGFWHSVASPQMMTLIAYRDPALARKINRLLFDGMLDRKSVV